MLKFTCKFDMGKATDAISSFKGEVKAAMEDIGKDAVQYAVDNGTYRNITGRLRRSNKYEVTEDKLTLINDAPYAADVEARGRDVLSGAHLFAHGQLKEKFEE